MDLIRSHVMVCGGTGCTSSNSAAVIAEFEKKLSDGYELFKTMTDDQVDRWCFYDMKKRGVID